MKMHQFKFIPMASGIGDLFNAYLEEDLGYFADMKRQGVTTKVVVWAVSDQASDIFKLNPNIDVVEINEWVRGCPAHTPPDEEAGPYMKKMAQAREKTFALVNDEDRAHYHWERPAIYMDPREAAIAEEIVNDGPFVVFHPFAGHPERWLSGSMDIGKLALRMCDEGFRVVIVGGPSLRIDRAHERLVDRMPDVTHPRLINLVGQHTVRLHGYLTSQAWKFVGSTSCYNCVAHQFAIPSLCFTNPGNRRFITRDKWGIFMRMREQGTIVHYFDGTFPHDPIGEVIKFLRK